MKKQDEDENELIDDDEDYDDIVDSLYKEANLHFQDENGMRELLLKKYPNVRKVIEDREFKSLTQEETEAFILLCSKSRYRNRKICSKTHIWRK